MYSPIKEPVLSVDSRKGDVFLERIPDEIYQQMESLFSRQYNFQNGERMRLANCYVGLRRSLADAFTGFVKEMMLGLEENRFPNLPPPPGFETQKKNLVPEEQKGGFSFGSFDMAVTEDGLQNIEFQSVATYPFSAASLNQLLMDEMKPQNAFIFADDKHTRWEDFVEIYTSIIAGDEVDGVAMVDRKVREQKTNFEFLATQKHLRTPLHIVSSEDVFERDDNLYFHSAEGSEPIKVSRFYNRILLAEALFEDNYPASSDNWKFRFDHRYDSLKFVNHPIKQFEVSKRLSPYIDHQFNPTSYELKEADEMFRRGELAYDEFVWKHKWGAAGHRLILSPTEKILDSLSHDLEDYIAQKKVAFKVFKTQEGLEKIVELRFMTAHHEGKLNIVPMARIGHVVREGTEIKEYKIHFGDNNKAGFGFSPVIIFED